MVELRTYFCENYFKHDYYMHKFQELLNWRGNFDELWVCDEQDAIDKFKELIKPYNKNNPIVDIPNDNYFIYICFYLNDIGYYIKEFPVFLERPTDRWDFSYNKIRNKIIERDGYFGSVTWQDRRIFVDNLSFIKNNKHKLSSDISKILKIVSTRNSEFNNMTLNEKLEAICNSIEYILKPKKGDNFIVLDYSDTEGLLTDNIVKDYRNKMECFRHSTKEDIDKRDKYSDEQKLLFIDFGLIIIDYIKKKNKS